MAVLSRPVYRGYAPIVVEISMLTEEIVQFAGTLKAVYRRAAIAQEYVFDALAKRDDCLAVQAAAEGLVDAAYADFDTLLSSPSQTNAFTPLTDLAESNNIWAHSDELKRAERATARATTVVNHKRRIFDDILDEARGMRHEMCDKIEELREWCEGIGRRVGRVGVNEEELKGFVDRVGRAVTEAEAEWIGGE